MTRWQPLLLGLAAVALVSGGVRAQDTAAQPWQKDVAGSLSANVPDGFTLAAVGDIQVTRPLSRLRDGGFQATLKWLRGADVAAGNLETTLIDVRHFAGYPGFTENSLRPLGAPAVAGDLKAMGFGLLARANNHATDWSLEGMRETDRLLDQAGIVHAGTGENRAAARGAAYLDTPKGRVGFVSLTSTFEDGELALPPLGMVPGRAGASTLRTTRIVLVDRDAMLALRKLLAAQPKGSADFATAGNRLMLFGVVFQESNRFGFTFDVNATDRDEFLRAIRQGKLASDFLVVNIHCHEPGNWSDEPADFLPPLARAAIDAGADAIIVEGPHHLRGIEVYKGKPIFYSLGNFIIQFAPQQPVAEDMYEKLGADPQSMTDAEMIQSRIGVHVEQKIWYESVVAVAKFAHGTVSEIRLYPIDLALHARMADRGIPHAASADVAGEILDRIAKLSAPFGTRIAIAGGVGIIRGPDR